MNKKDKLTDSNCRGNINKGVTPTSQSPRSAGHNLLAGIFYCMRFQTVAIRDGYVSVSVAIFYFCYTRGKK